MAGGKASPYLARARLLPEVPANVDEPKDVRQTVGTPASFPVRAVGTEPLAYQWLKDGTNLTEGGAILGVSTDSLILMEALVADSGGYSVTASNALGAVTSAVAILRVITA